MKISRILLSTSGAESWKPFLAQPDKQWRAGYSAWALAHCWEAAAGFPEEIQLVLALSGQANLTELEPLLGLPEYAVPLRGGDRSSMNDLFVLGRGPEGAVTIMVEGKVNETFGHLVKDWGPDSTPGKTERWRYLLDLLEVSGDNCDELRYQLFHRTASALIEARRFRARDAVMLVHSFSERDTGFDDYAAFVRLFRVEVAVGRLASLGERDGTRLHVGWVRGDREFLGA